MGSFSEALAPVAFSFQGAAQPGWSASLNWHHLMKEKSWQVGLTLDADPCCGAHGQTRSEMSSAPKRHSATSKQALVNESFAAGPQVVAAAGRADHKHHSCCLASERAPSAWLAALCALGLQ